MKIQRQQQIHTGASHSRTKDFNRPQRFGRPIPNTFYRHLWVCYLFRTCSGVVRSVFLTEQNNLHRDESITSGRLATEVKGRKYL